MNIRPFFNCSGHSLLYLVASVLFLSTSLANAAPIYQLSSGYLTGIQNLEVNGNFYDVEFVDGEIQSLYDLSDPFFFTNASDASDATLALLHALSDVAEGDFDSDPLSVFGCAGDNCLVHVPYLYDFGYVSTEWFRNAASEFDDERGGSDLLPTYNSTGVAANFTQWQRTTVPESSSITLMLVGLAALSFSRRRFLKMSKQGVI